MGYTHLSSLGPCGSAVLYMPRVVQPENYFVMFMWRSAFVYQNLLVFPRGTSWTMQCIGQLLPPSGVDLILFNFHIQNKVAENRLFLFIHTEMGWICISSQNNPEIWLRSVPPPLKQTYFSVGFQPAVHSSVWTCTYCKYTCIHWCACGGGVLLSTFLSLYLLRSTYLSVFF